MQLPCRPSSAPTRRFRGAQPCCQNVPHGLPLGQTLCFAAMEWTATHMSNLVSRFGQVGSMRWAGINLYWCPTNDDDEDSASDTAIAANGTADVAVEVSSGWDTRPHWCLCCLQMSPCKYRRPACPQTCTSPHHVASSQPRRFAPRRPYDAEGGMHFSDYVCTITQALYAWYCIHLTVSPLTMPLHALSGTK